ncbi:hypothetical protein GCM10027072_73770 [Streptomyces bullii]
MRFLDEHDVRSVFDIDTAIASQRTAFLALALARGEAWQPEKILGGHADDPDTVLCYAARLDRASGPVCKFGSINPENAGTAVPTINAVITVLDPRTGVPLAFMDGTAVTTLRTAAASAVAVEALARKEAARLLVLGAGVQGQAHIKALQHDKHYAWTGMWSPRPSSRDASVGRGSTSNRWSPRARRSAGRTSSSAPPRPSNPCSPQASWRPASPSSQSDPSTGTVARSDRTSSTSATRWSSITNRRPARTAVRSSPPARTLMRRGSKSSNSAGS